MDFFFSSYVKEKRGLAVFFVQRKTGRVNFKFMSFRFVGHCSLLGSIVIMGIILTVNFSGVLRVYFCLYLNGVCIYFFFFKFLL